MGGRVAVYSELAVWVKQGLPMWRGCGWGWVWVTRQQSRRDGKSNVRISEPRD